MGRNVQCFFGVVREDEAASVPIVIGGRFVASDEAAGWAEWHAELFDNLVCHPELLLEPRRRTFHIGCTHHEAARQILAAGGIPADFHCPLNLANCPMLWLLSRKTAGLHSGAIHPAPDFDEPLPDDLWAGQ